MRFKRRPKKWSGHPPLNLKSVKKGVYSCCLKRPLDFLLALNALIILSPILLLTAILVRVKLGRPIIFKQERPGRQERIFTLYKFRTMADRRDKNGHLLPDKVRLTEFGKFLRLTSLDELPELVNILKGDMALVGPRPLLPSYLPYYSPTERLRHAVRPGLTGLAQVSGRNFLVWNDRLAKDVEYSTAISLRGDLVIILKTIQKVFTRSDIAVDTEAEGNLADIRKKHFAEQEAAAAEED